VSFIIDTRNLISVAATACGTPGTVNAYDNNLFAGCRRACGTHVRASGCVVGAALTYVQINVYNYPLHALNFQ
jgi:hypothetical protein